MTATGRDDGIGSENRLLRRFPALWKPLAVAILLVVYGNATIYLEEYSQLSLPGNSLLPNTLSVAILLLWARSRARLLLEELGLQKRGVIRSGLWGAAIGLLIASLAALVLAFPPLPVPIAYPEFRNQGSSQLLWRLLVELPFATALCEELAFRGVLQAMFCRSLLPLRAAIGTNAAFALWHMAVNFHTVSGTNIGAMGLAPLAVLGAMVSVFVGGMIFSVLRLRTGNLVGSIVAHWLIDALMTLAAYVHG